MKYLFFLGRKTEIATFELQVLLKRLSVSMDPFEVSSNVYGVEANNLDIQKLQDLSGGIVKIVEVLDEKEEQTITKQDVAQYLLDYASTHDKKKVVFSIYEQGKRLMDSEDLPWIKKELQTAGISSRYLETDTNGLSAAQLIHHDICELVLVYGDKLYIGITKTAQNIDAWSNIDFGKPYRDAKKGMLPPKLARMMVNLALSDSFKKDSIIYDPFCGSATVLMEANILGIDAIGSDLDKDAISGSEKNLKWLKTVYTKLGNSTVFAADATHVDVRQLPKKVDYIVTEPFLGRTNPKEQDADNVLRGLSKMYIGMFKTWKTLLAPKAKIVCVFPQLRFENDVKTMNKVIDMIETLGYTRENGPFIYDRPQTVVQRAIYIFRYQ